MYSDPKDVKNLDALLEYLEEQETQHKQKKLSQQAKEAEQGKQAEEDPEQQTQDQQKDQEKDQGQGQEEEKSQDVSKFTQTLSRVPGLEQVMELISTEDELKSVLEVMLGAASEKLKKAQVKRALRALFTDAIK